MGYHTEFTGKFLLDKPLSKEDLTFLQKFNETRRMKRNVDKKFGIEGEFFVDGTGYAGQDVDSTVSNGNQPPKTQPGLWCQWRPNDEGTEIEWDGGEKFYAYVEWLQYLIDNIFSPRGYTLNGEVEWYGEDSDDRGKIVVENNVVTTKKGTIVYED